MSVGVIVIAHGRLASALLEAAEQIMGCQKNVAAVDVFKGENEAVVRDKLKKAFEKMDAQIDGTLILTDLFGGSPCTICLSFSQGRNVRILSGVNMPMLVSAIIYRGLLPLDELADKVYQAGRKGVVDATWRMS